MKEANVYYSQLARDSTHFRLASRDCDSVRDDQSSHLLVDCAYVGERYNELKSICDTVYAYICDPAKDIGVKANVTFGHI